MDSSRGVRGRAKGSLTSPREKTERDVIDRINNQHVKESIIFMSFEQSRYFVCKLNFDYVGQKLITVLPSS